MSKQIEIEKVVIQHFCKSLEELTKVSQTELRPDVLADAMIAAGARVNTRT